MPGSPKRCQGFLEGVAFREACTPARRQGNLPGQETPYPCLAYPLRLFPGRVAGKLHRDCTWGKPPVAYAAELWEKELR